MKKFLVLLCFLLAFAVGSYAQDRQVVLHSDSYNLGTLGYHIYDHTPNEWYQKHYSVHTSVSVVPPEGIEYTSVNVRIEYLIGSDDYLFDDSTNDLAEVSLHFDIRQVYKIHYSFEVYFKNGTGEIYDVEDTYNNL